MDEKKTENRHKIEQWSITFPQCDKNKRWEKKDFIEMFPPLKQYCCVEELHDDGNRHIHLGLKLKKGLNKTALKKWIDSKFPDDCFRIHYQPCRNFGNWEDYLCKEDPNPIIWSDGSDNFKGKKQVDKVILVCEDTVNWKKNNPSHLDCFEEATKVIPEINERVKLLKEEKEYQNWVENFHNLKKKNIAFVKKIAKARQPF